MKLGLARSHCTAAASSSPATNRSSTCCSRPPPGRSPTANRSVSPRPFRPLRRSAVRTLGRAWGRGVRARRGTCRSPGPDRAGHGAGRQLPPTSRSPVPADADVIRFPGGEPALIPRILPGSPALAAIDTARRKGAVLAGASAGAMADGAADLDVGRRRGRPRDRAGDRRRPARGPGGVARIVAQNGELLPPGIGRRTRGAHRRHRQADEPWPWSGKARSDGSRGASPRRSSAARATASTVHAWRPRPDVPPRTDQPRVSTSAARGRSRKIEESARHPPMRSCRSARPRRPCRPRSPR